MDSAATAVFSDPDREVPETVAVKVALTAVEADQPAHPSAPASHAWVVAMTVGWFFRRELGKPALAAFGRERRLGSGLRNDRTNE